MADLPLGHAVRRIREQRGMDKNQLAAASGLTRQYIWKIESGFVGDPQLRTIDALAVGLGTELWKLLRFAQQLRAELEKREQVS